MANGSLHTARSARSQRSLAACDRAFDQDRPGLHHLCVRARNKEDVDAVYRFAVDELAAKIVHAPEDGSQFAPGYYSVLFEDPDGIRIEFNFVPGRGHLGEGGQLGPDGEGPSTFLPE